MFSSSDASNNSAVISSVHGTPNFLEKHILIQLQASCAIKRYIVVDNATERAGNLGGQLEAKRFGDRVLKAQVVKTGKDAARGLATVCETVFSESVYRLICK